MEPQSEVNNGPYNSPLGPNYKVLDDILFNSVKFG